MSSLDYDVSCVSGRDLVQTRPTLIGVSDGWQSQESGSGALKG